MNICPTCGQELPQPRGRRICSACGRPIARHDKWEIYTDGKLRHKDCSVPTGTPKQNPTMELIK